MSVSKERVAELVAKFGRGEKDCGSPEVQIAVFTEQIITLTEHLKVHKHDNHSRRGLHVLVGKRNSMIKYLKSISVVRHQAILAALNLRK